MDGRLFIWIPYTGADVLCVYMSYYVTVAIQMFLFRLTRRERRVCERSTGCFYVEGDHRQMLFDLNPFRRSLRFRLVPDRFQ